MNKYVKLAEAKGTWSAVINKLCHLSTQNLKRRLGVRDFQPLPTVQQDITPPEIRKQIHNQAFFHSHFERTQANPNRRSSRKHKTSFISLDSLKSYERFIYGDDEYECVSSSFCDNITAESSNNVKAKALSTTSTNQTNNLSPIITPKLLLQKSLQKSNKKQAKHVALQRAQVQSYDYTVAHPECNTEIKTQGRCSDCWAFSGTAVMKDRLCLLTKGEHNMTLSIQEVISCGNNGGCDGGLVRIFWDYAQKYGIVSEQCLPYNSHNGTLNPPTCPSKCANGALFSSSPLYMVESYHVLPNDPDAIRKEILFNGPVQATFNVTADFFTYKSGIYQSVSNEHVGAHAVRIVGFGHDEKTKTNYWKCANSWSADFGENGYFNIKEGEGGIETNVIAPIMIIPRRKEVVMEPTLIPPGYMFVSPTPSLSTKKDTQDFIQVLFSSFSTSNANGRQDSFLTLVFVVFITVFVL
ncbi:hypothetical protein AKO1_002302 [Acrasis kona]|uniref:Peptidase C1A papain C-terminal domain-containing protein n=1 Tax=Acrasis kona TaxID=1008807 RepID=A0AAW2ZR99_9EUKA